MIIVKSYIDVGDLSESELLNLKRCCAEEIKSRIARQYQLGELPPLSVEEINSLKAGSKVSAIRSYRVKLGSGSNNLIKAKLVIDYYLISNKMI